MTLLRRRPAPMRALLSHRSAGHAIYTTNSRHRTYEGLSNSKTAGRRGRSCDSTISNRSDSQAGAL